MTAANLEKIEAAALEFSDAAFAAAFNDSPMDYAVGTLKTMELVNAFPPEMRAFIAEALPEIVRFAMDEAKRTLEEREAMAA